jgi:hypothetical protein
MLAAQAVGDGGGQAAKHLIRGIDHEPFVLQVRGDRAVRIHEGCSFIQTGNRALTGFTHACQ